MIRVARHNEMPFEINAELVTFLESLPEGVTFVNVDGEILVRLQQPRMTGRTRINAVMATGPAWPGPKLPAQE